MTVADEHDVEGDDLAEVVTTYIEEEMQQVEMRLQITCTDDED